MNFLISQEFANGLISYLIKRPYEEVSAFIDQLTKLQRVDILPSQEKQPMPPAEDPQKE